MLWFQGLSAKNQAKVLSKIHQLQDTAKDQWRLLRFVKKQAGGTGLCEIIFSLDVEYRIVGYFFDNKIFIMLHCFSKNTQRSQNRRGFDLADDRKKQIKGREEEHTHEYNFEENERPGKTIH